MNHWVVAGGIPKLTRPTAHTVVPGCGLGARKGTAGGSCPGGHSTAVRLTSLQAWISPSAGEGIGLGLGLFLLGNVLVPLRQMQYVCVWREPWVTPNFMSISTGTEEFPLLCQTLALQPGTIFVSVWQALTWWWKPLNPPILSDGKGSLLDLENLVSKNRKKEAVRSREPAKNGQDSH